MMALVIALVFVFLFFWLRIYTNHGQKLTLPDYVGQKYDEAVDDAKDKSFELIVKDSVYKVGQPGGIVLSQNPRAKAEVKEKRKIYVDVTKYNADEYRVKDMPTLYGRQYNAQVNMLNQLQINSKIKGYRYDIGEPNFILEVWYEGRMIAGPSGRNENIKIKKGGTLEFVLSKSEGAEIEIPNLVCEQLVHANFILDMTKLGIGSIEKIGGITDRETAYIVEQNPAYEEGKTITTGSTITIKIQQDKPVSCQ